MKLKPVILFLIFISSYSFSQDRTWNYIQLKIQSIDSAANHIVKQTHSVLRKKSKVKCISTTTKGIKRSSKTKFTKGNVIVREKYSIKNEWYIRVLIVNGQVELIRSTSIEKGFVSPIENTFTHLGNASWQWTYTVYDNGLKTYKNVVLNNWLNGNLPTRP